MAGRMAAVLFNALGYLAWICGVLQLVTNPSKKIVWLIALALLASVLIHFGVSPRIVAKVDLRFWHALGSVLFALQWLLVSALLLVKPNNQP